MGQGRKRQHGGAKWQQPTCNMTSSCQECPPLAELVHPRCSGAASPTRRRHAKEIAAIANTIH